MRQCYLIECEWLKKRHYLKKHWLNPFLTWQKVSIYKFKLCKAQTEYEENHLYFHYSQIAEN